MSATGFGWKPIPVNYTGANLVSYVCSEGESNEASYDKIELIGKTKTIKLKIDLKR